MVYILYRIETIEFDCAPVHYGYFSTMEKAEAAKAKLESIKDQLYCLDKHPRDFKIGAVEMDKLLLPESVNR